MAAVMPQGLLQVGSWQNLLLPEPDLVKANEATIQGFEKLIEACWQLSRRHDLALAEKLLPECMSRLVPLAQQPSKYRQTAAGLAAQGYLLYSIMARAKIGQTGLALDVFARIDQPGIVVPERIRLEILNQRAKTAIVSGDLEQGSAYVEAGISGAKLLGSQKRWNEAYGNYQQMTLLWPEEQRVKELGELFRT